MRMEKLDDAATGLRCAQILDPDELANLLATCLNASACSDTQNRERLSRLRKDQADVAVKAGRQKAAARGPRYPSAEHRLA